jgi:Mn-dependent DtxR family transcriptional regulator
MAEVSRSVGRYLCAVHLLSMGGNGPAKTTELADRLAVSNASVTEMLGALEDRGLATYEKYQGVELTPEGETTARELLWKHCVAENFLEEEADAADGGTRAFGHALSDEVATRLRAYIDHPCDGQCGAPNAEYAECREDVRGEY